MAQPDWSKITPDGKPLGWQSDGEKKALKEVEELKEEIKQLKLNNEELLELLEEPKDNK